MKSLRRRLLSALMLTIVLFWALWGVFWAGFMWWENKGWVDSTLRGTAELVLYSLPRNLGSLDAAPEWKAAAPAPPAYRQEATVFQVWVGRRLVIRSPGVPDAPLRSSFAEGFSRETVDHRRFRVYALADPQRRIQVQVGRPMTTRDPDSLSGLVSALAGMVLMFALLGLAIWRVILTSLKPVNDVCAQLQREPALDFTPVALDHLPEELRPLVAAFNRTLERLGRALEGERRFIADAAHELRTPLAVMAVQAQVALDADTLEDKDGALNQLSAGVARAARLSAQLLDLARADASAGRAHHVAVDLAQLLDLLLDDLQFVAASKHQRMSLRTEPCVVRCDANAIGTLVRNLLDNALRYTQEHGRIDLACKRVNVQGADKICLTVADNGPGVAPDQRTRIFHRFYRIAGNAHRGSGIGLSLVQRIAHAHGAAIVLDHGLDGRGLAVAIYFDVAP